MKKYLALVVMLTLCAVPALAQRGGGHGGGGGGGGEHGHEPGMPEVPGAPTMPEPGGTPAPAEPIVDAPEQTG